MPLPAEEIQRRLTAFAKKWSSWQGTEKSGAQTFLLELLACYGTDPADVGAEFELKVPSGWIDLLWPGICLVEMKQPGEGKKLTQHYRNQALAYWNEAGTAEHDPAQFVVMCSFHRFQVWRPGYQQPEAEFELVELPYRLEALGFLGGLETRFIRDRAELTREAAQLVTTLYGRLNDRLTMPETVRNFVLQCVWCLFAEDLALLPGHVFSGLVENLLKTGGSTLDDLGQLFEWLNRPGGRPEHGKYAGVPFVNGQLFAQPAAIHLEPDELELLAQACEYRWNLVEPAIFGSLLEGALGKERQWALGAHYTSEASILQVVDPTIVEPWKARVVACETLGDVTAAQDDLAAFHVLDPACGSGNFLYVAYLELRRIEVALAEREVELRTAAGLPATHRTKLFTLDHLHGLEREPFAAMLARVTLWMGHALAVHKLGLEDEPVLPLADLSNIRATDALWADWPDAQAIVGNPPYHGSQQIRRELGDAYAEELRKQFGIGLKDYAVYWFRKAHSRLPPGGRAGFVVTNSISQNRNREPSLEWIVANGGVIVDAVSKQPWLGAAVVNVSIVNWVKQPDSPPQRFVLDGVEVAGITPALRPAGEDVSGAKRLSANAGRAFQGPIPAGAGFVLEPAEAESLLARTDADYSVVVRPYLVGEDIAEQPEQRPRRFIIDFGKRPLEEAEGWPAAMAIVRKRVKPDRDRANREPNRTYWWQFERPRIDMHMALTAFSRYVAANAQGKRILFTWQDASVCPSNLTNVFAFDDDASMGVLTSRLHGEWAKSQSSTLRVDIRYTPTSAFETFPWPSGNREEIGERARALLARRSELCLEHGIGLTRLYNLLDEGGFQDLRVLHRLLDEAVAAGYGWPRSLAQDGAETNRRLLELNEAISQGKLSYSPFAVA